MGRQRPPGSGNRRGAARKPGLIVKVSGLVGTPIQYMLDRLPKGAGDKITNAVQFSLRAAVNTAAITLGRRGRGRSWLKSHMAAAGVSGGVGGIFACRPADRVAHHDHHHSASIADVARSEGEDLLPRRRGWHVSRCLPWAGRLRVTTRPVRLLCGTGALARAVSEAAKYVAGRTMVEDGAPVIVRLLAQIAARFNTVVGDKIIAQGVPVLGALGGASIMSFSSITSRIWPAGTLSCAASVKFDVDEVRATTQPVGWPGVIKARRPKGARNNEPT